MVNLRTFKRLIFRWLVNADVCGSGKVMVLCESNKTNVKRSAKSLWRNLENDAKYVSLTSKRVIRLYAPGDKSLAPGDSFFEDLYQAEQIFVSSPNSIFVNLLDVNFSRLSEVIFFQHGVLNKGFIDGVELFKRRYPFLTTKIATWETCELNGDMRFPTPKEYSNSKWLECDFSAATSVLKTKEGPICFASNGHSSEVPRLVGLRMLVYCAWRFRERLFFCPHPDERAYNSLTYIASLLFRVKHSKVSDVASGILVTLPSTVLMDTENEKFHSKICLT